MSRHESRQKLAREFGATDMRMVFPVLILAMAVVGSITLACADANVAAGPESAQGHPIRR
jgi:hypothetical protein